LIVDVLFFIGDLFFAFPEEAFIAVSVCLCSLMRLRCTICRGAWVRRHRKNASSLELRVRASAPPVPIEFGQGGKPGLGSIAWD
jgi:hypothetical protein